MRLIIYDDTVKRPLPFYLAMEEYFAQSHEGDFFFMWQVDPTVIIGRHQLLEAEIDTGFCRSHNIDIVRRKSGGGAVYADRNNIMFSHITRSGNVTDCFREYTGRVAGILRGLGLDARASDRNDVLIGDRKVSGNAFYHQGNRNIVHGTMLYDTDCAMMEGALTPSAMKLKSKGVSSVKSRITTLREHLPTLSIGDFRRYVAEKMSDGREYCLTDADVASIRQLAASYSAPGWLTGKNPAGIVRQVAHIPGVGEISATVATGGGRIQSLSLTGDFFAEPGYGIAIDRLLNGVEYSPGAVGEALADTDISELIHGLTTKQLIDLIF